MYKELLYQINKQFEDSEQLSSPEYKVESHVHDLATKNYWNAILNLRHVIRLACDNFFAYKKNGINVDLFMITPSISSPMGPGSDSETIPIKFGNLETFLVDSSQFGFEPILMNNFDLLYCYLPSMRGENPDKRHLNQFFHCEAELKGNLNDVIRLVEDYIKSITNSLYEVSSLVSCLSLSPEHSIKAIQTIIKTENFKKITFDLAVKTLEEHGYSKYINYTNHGRDISNQGEIELAKIISPSAPFWITHFDRDRVPFYQKPNPENKNQTLNADLIFPPLIETSFGGEIVGCGQRQDTESECCESLDRQNLSKSQYDWYISLRGMPEYNTTSGFGMGIERYITWLLCRDDIKNSIPYPRLKNITTLP